MFIKAIVFTASLCVVKSSTVTVNLYDGPENQGSNSLHDCDYQGCDQLCRRLGFPGSACVGDRCECDNFRKIEDHEYQASHSLRDCNYQGCDQLCRRLGFPGGACVGDRCECDNFRKIKDNENEVSHSLLDCKDQACNQVCLWFGFPGGACVGDRCNCDDLRKMKVNLSHRQNRFLTVTIPIFEEVTDEENEVEGTGFHLMSFKDDLPSVLIPGACSPVTCNDMCHRLNYIGGVCLGGSCQCY